jgi:hypothetical protein
MVIWETCRELGGFGGISSDSRNVNHGGMGSDSGSGEVKKYNECQ